MRDALLLVVDEGEIGRVAPREIRVRKIGDAIRVAGHLKPQVVIVGRVEPATAGAVQALRGALPDAAIVVLADRYGDGEALDCVAAGADFYGVQKEMDLRPVIIAAVRVARKRTARRPPPRLRLLHH